MKRETFMLIEFTSLPFEKFFSGGFSARFDEKYFQVKFQGY